jgi:putative Ca2+/H+ antiporter (TMEM165/GDT1 family)
VWVTGLLLIGFGLSPLDSDALSDAHKVRHADAFVTTVIAFFVAETGDKMRLATVALAAHFQAPFQVILGTTHAMLLADFPQPGLATGWCSACQ